MSDEATVLTADQRRWATRRARFGPSGQPVPSAERRGILCSIPGCESPTKRHGMCRLHDYRVSTHGDPDKRLRAPPGSRGAWVRANADHGGDDCLLWPFPHTANERDEVFVEGRKMPASRYMCRVAHGEPPSPKHEAAHNCGKGHLGCLNPRHLEWKTRGENCADTLRHGTRRRGHTHGMAKLTEPQIREIRGLLGTVTHKEIAARYGVHESLISLISRRKAWGWLP